MKIATTAGFLVFGLAFATGVQTASAASLSELRSACNTGDYTACSAYNAGVVAQYGGQNQVLTQGYDPFAIVPASHSERTPKPPQDNTGKPGVALIDLKIDR